MSADYLNIFRQELTICKFMSSRKLPMFSVLRRYLGAVRRSKASPILAALRIDADVFNSYTQHIKTVGYI
jgi:hypothetical protein